MIFDVLCRLLVRINQLQLHLYFFQTVQSGKHVIMKGQSRHKDVTSQEKITESHDLSMRDLADLIWDDAFRKDSKNKRKLPHRTNKNNAHATGNERVRLDQEEENIPACEPQRQALAGPQQGISCLQTMVGVQTGRTNKNNAHATKNGRRQTLAGPQQGIPGLQTTAGVQTGIAYQNAETMEPVIGFSHQQGVTQIEPPPGEPTRHDPEGLQAMRVPSPQYPAMIQIDLISREDISSSRVQATRAPVDPQEKCLPSHEIPEATGTPPETSHVEAEPSTPVGHMQQPSDHLVEPDSADNGAHEHDKLHAGGDNRTRECLRVTVSQTKQHLEKMDARGLHMAHEENGTVVREVLVPGGRVGAPPFPGLDKSGMLRDAEDSGVLRDAEESGVAQGPHVDEKPSIGREAHIVRLKCKPESGEIKEGAYTHLMVSYFLRHSGSIATSFSITAIDLVYSFPKEGHKSFE
ncbi:hypothetical protein PR048_027316 [Dryococelus australis]|uniref:Uncharacterized protein n=1 Tax=Dryococelus australis TaxID=614101 RepID=A0ABQ9GF49_9NEOP|nr:hypothetical protein PR048_027316 [Dryococelus australis]